MIATAGTMKHMRREARAVRVGVSSANGCSFVFGFDDIATPLFLLAAHQHFSTCAHGGAAPPLREIPFPRACAEDDGTTMNR
jgi:hypothetical protein